jgi:rhomboid family GlyGly-CTERM serine protease
VVIHAVLGTPEYLVFERGEGGPLDLARLFTCHLTHWSWEHLLWDAAVFAVVGSWCERLDRRAFAVFLVASAVAIPPIVLLVRSDLGSYAGLSGIDIGAAALAVCLSLGRAVRRDDRGAAALIATFGVALVAKLIYELVAGRTVMFDEDAGFVPVPLAHLVGVVVGLIVALAKVVKQRPVRQDRAA